MMNKTDDDDTPDTMAIIDGAYLVQLLLYVILGFVALAFLIENHVSRKRLANKQRTHTLFHVLLIASTCGRIVYIFLCMLPETRIYFGPLAARKYVLRGNLFPDLVSLGFYSTFLCLIFIWSKLVFQAYAVRVMRSTRHPKLRFLHMTLFGLIVGTSFLIICSFGLASHWSGNPELYRYAVLVVYFPFLAFATGIAFIIFSFALCFAVSCTAGLSRVGPFRFAKIGFLALAGTGSFFIRALTCLVQNLTIDDLIGYHWQYELAHVVFFILVEWLVALVVVIALNLINTRSPRLSAPSPLVSSLRTEPPKETLLFKSFAPTKQTS